jgi:diketogulonate reductase-like aldo/keto reductase
VTPYQVREELCRFCQENGIHVEAFSPLTMGLKLKEPRLNKIAQKYGKQPAQILIRWLVKLYII